MLVIATSNTAATSGVPRPTPSNAAAEKGPGARQHRGRRGWQHRGCGGWEHRGRQRVSSQCSRQPQPNGEAVERADPPIKPVRCCHRAPGQRQQTEKTPAPWRADDRGRGARHPAPRTSRTGQPRTGARPAAARRFAPAASAPSMSSATGRTHRPAASSTGPATCTIIVGQPVWANRWRTAAFPVRRTPLPERAAPTDQPAAPPAAELCHSRQAARRAEPASRRAGGNPVSSLRSRCHGKGRVQPRLEFGSVRRRDYA